MGHFEGVTPTYGGVVVLQQHHEYRLYTAGRPAVYREYTGCIQAVSRPHAGSMQVAHRENTVGTPAVYRACSASIPMNEGLNTCSVLDAAGSCGSALISFRPPFSPIALIWLRSNPAGTSPTALFARGGALVHLSQARPKNRTTVQNFPAHERMKN